MREKDVPDLEGSIRRNALRDDCAPPKGCEDIKGPQWQNDGAGGVICQHGHAMDVHCCNCHGGFVFDGMEHDPPCLLADADAVRRAVGVR